jgi:hypothetical protein
MIDGISWNTTFWVDSERKACMRCVFVCVGRYQHVKCRNLEGYIHLHVLKVESPNQPRNQWYLEHGSEHTYCQNQVCMELISMPTVCHHGVMLSHGGNLY